MKRHQEAAAHVAEQIVQCSRSDCFTVEGDNTEPYALQPAECNQQYVPGGMLVFKCSALSAVCGDAYRTVPFKLTAMGGTYHMIIAQLMRMVPCSVQSHRKYQGEQQ